MGEKVEITICLGSSCFARGNKKIINVIQSYITAHQLEDRVFLNGGHCFGDCSKGPIIRINKKIYENVDALSVFDILAKEFG
jgi:NADH:ubiquinone oxidoreductase subunit E